MLAAVVIAAIPAIFIAVPIISHVNQGLSGQTATAEDWPLTVTATGDDDRERTLTVAGPDGAAIDTSALAAGDRLVVTGSGYDGSRGIYVAICRIPEDAATKPGPCIGGVPETDGEAIEEGSVDYAPSNWINDDWAWKLLGARSYDSVADGTFTAYIEVGEPVSDDLDCTVDACGLYTRNDHTAANDRVQDLHVPVGFAG